jgi:hypothetical protein
MLTVTLGGFGDDQPRSQLYPSSIARAIKAKIDDQQPAHVTNAAHGIQAGAT